MVSGNALVYGDALVSGNARVYGNAWVYGDALVSGNARVYGDALVSGNARVSAKVAFTLGWFFGGDDSGKITDITDKTGSDYWKDQYVLGDYKIEPIEDEQVIKKNPTEITVEGATYRLVEND